MRPKLREWCPVIVLALIPALPLLVGNGLLNTRAGGDSPFLLIRVHQLVFNLRAGVLPVRWMPQAAYGLGYPFFNFYASLPYYLAAAFKLAGLGYIASIQWTQALGFVFAAMAIYALSRELPGAPHRRCASLLVALVYSCAPFHMVNVYVRGDSLSEFYAFVFFPLILWSLLRLQRQANAYNAAWVALSYAGLLLTHNISAWIFSPFALLYALWLAWGTKDARQSVVRSFTALAAGLLASAWFWLPALAERGNVYLREMTTGYFHYAQHFRSTDLVQPSLVFDYAITADKQPFQMGLLQGVLALAGVVAVVIWWTRLRRVESQSAFLVTLLAISSFMITPLSRPLWDLLPLLPMVQFPWRFLSIQALATSLLVAYLIPPQRQRLLAPDSGQRVSENVQTRHPERSEGRQSYGREMLHFVQHDVSSNLSAHSGELVLALLVVFAALSGLHPEWLFIDEADITTQRLMLYEYFTANVGTTIRTDYLPRWVDPRPYTSEAFWQGEVKPPPLTIEGQVSSANFKALGPTSESWAIDVASAESLLAFHTYYYPGWEARVDGRPAQIEPLPGLGYIGLRLAQGQHDVHLQLERTKAQRIAELLSVLAAGVLLAMLALRLSRHHGFAVATSVAPFTSTIARACATSLQKRRALGVIAVVLPALALLAIGGRAIVVTLSGAGWMARTAPAAQLLDLTMDFDRLPYLHHNPDGVNFDDVARLTHYELSSQEMRAGQTLTVTTYWDNVTRNDLMAKAAVVSAGQHLFGVPLSVVRSEEPLGTLQVQHVLQIPASTMRGMYLIPVQVYGPEGEIRPLSPRGETLGTTYLLPIRIDNYILASGNETILQMFGDHIALSKADTVQQSAGTLKVTLTWHVLASPSQNYKTALRFKDSTGWEVARLDIQPGYGFYPTSMWRAGELVHDRYVLPIDDGTPPDMAYSLDVTLYEAATLQPIGTAKIQHVVLAYPTVRQGYPVLHLFSPALALSEAQLRKPELEQGEKVVLSLKWAARTPIDRDYECRVMLLNAAGVPIGQQIGPLARGYPSSLWPKDAVMNSHYELQLASDIPVGQYRIALTVVEAVSRKEVDTFTLPSPVRIVEAARNFVIPKMQTPVGADFGGQVRLLGYELQHEGQELRLKLHWQALAPMVTNYKTFVHLFDPAKETIMAQQDVFAGGEGYPTTRWVPQEVVSDDIQLRLEDIQKGNYTLAVGLYHAEGRLPVVAPPEFTVSADRLLLNETIQVP